MPFMDRQSCPTDCSLHRKGSAVTFGSIDDDLIVTGCHTSHRVGGCKVFRFGDSNDCHAMGKAFISKPIAASTSVSTSSTPSPSTPTKPLKIDVRMFFQGASSPAPPPQPENSSPSMHPFNLPQQQSQPQQNSSQPPSQPS
ncbi:hypothetical protein C8R44DRAFT_747007 [Mycena epipterygia]|nr:hypothetical protein C8R44DRAFT_747007 [Mycena epipterygia]